MALLETLLLIFFGSIIAIFVLFYFWWTLTNHNLRTLLWASIPFLRGQKVLGFHFIGNRTYKLDLVPVEKNKLQKWKLKDGKRVLANKEIEKGTYWKDISTGTVTFFTADGAPKTFDPVVNKPGVNYVFEDMLKNAFDTGIEWKELLKEMSPTHELKGVSLGVAIILMVVFVAFMIGMQFSLNSQLGTIVQAMEEVRSSVS